MFLLLALLSLYKNIMNKSKKDIDPLILMRYLNGTGSSEDIRIVKNLFSDAGSEDELYEKSLAFWEGISLDHDIKGYNEAHILDTIHHKIRIEEAESLTKSSVLYTLMKYAAIIIVACSLSGALFYYIGRNKISNHVQGYSELIVPLGSHVHYTLPDGTAVTLNSGSSLKYDNRFGINDRFVELKGEGYFNVAKDKERIFTVKTSHINVTALGTAFNIRAYADDKTIETTLVEGSLKIEDVSGKDKADIVVLKPNQKLTFYIKDSTLVDETNSQKSENESNVQHANGQESISVPKTVTENVNVEPVISWTENKWIFEKKSLEEIAVELERKFDVQIIFETERLKTYRFTGIIMAEPIDQVLEVMSISAPINYKLKGRIVILSENKKFEESIQKLFSQD
jgi:transmembrane sensor